MISFLLNRELREEQHIDPNMTVLNYLREQRAKTGTKEGCASGDCGACTVVVAELDAQAGAPRLKYKSINACLTFVSALQGKQLITVEDLQVGDHLHPAQQALVDCHGSQCGFCTPGIVMSLFALGKNVAPTRVQPPSAEAVQEASLPGTEEINDALAGNLCRCTGYRPIVAAARAMLDKQRYADAGGDSFDCQESQTIAELQAIHSPQAVDCPGLKGCGHTSFNPRTVDELANLYRLYPEARLLAGGTDLALQVTQQHQSLETLIYIGDIEELQQVRVDPQHIELGAAATLSRCYQTLAGDYPDFGALLQRFASLQIRNLGTLGGNIANASPIGDMPPALLALGAELVLRTGSQRRTLKLEDFFIDYRVTALQPSEFIEQIVLPRAQAQGQFRCYKVSKRLDDDISAVLGCFNLNIQRGRVTGARIAFGGMAAIPQRARHCEQALLGEAWNQATVEIAASALAQDFTPIDDFRASKEYRMLVARNLLRRYFVELQSPDVETRVSAYV